MKGCRPTSGEAAVADRAFAFACAGERALVLALFLAVASDFLGLARGGASGRSTKVASSMMMPGAGLGDCGRGGGAGAGDACPRSALRTTRAMPIPTKHTMRGRTRAIFVRSAGADAAISAGESSPAWRGDTRCQLQSQSQREGAGEGEGARAHLGRGALDEVGLARYGLSTHPDADMGRGRD